MELEHSLATVAEARRPTCNLCADLCYLWILHFLLHLEHWWVSIHWNKLDSKKYIYFNLFQCAHWNKFGLNKLTSSMWFNWSLNMFSFHWNNTFQRKRWLYINQFQSSVWVTKIGQLWFDWLIDFALQLFWSSKQNHCALGARLPEGDRHRF